MAVSKALVVAIVAGVALIATISIDATMNRTIFVDVKDGDAWRTVAEQGDSGGFGRVSPEFPSTGIPVERNGTIDLRLRVDNGYYWGYSERYVVRSGGLILAEGTVDAPGRGVGESAFSVPAQRFFAGTVPDPKAGPMGASVNLDIEIGGTFVYVYFPIVEAS